MEEVPWKYNSSSNIQLIGMQIESFVQVFAYYCGNKFD